MPSNSNTLERQMAPPQAYLQRANTPPSHDVQPDAAHCVSDFLADPPEPTSPWRWLGSIAGRLVLAVILVGAIAVMFCLSPLIQHRQ